MNLGINSDVTIIAMSALLVILSIVPTIGDLFGIRYEDRIEKEPRLLLFKLFLIGLSVWIMAFLIEYLLGEPLTLLFPGTERTLGGSLTFESDTSALAYLSIYSFFIVGLFEEGLKFTLLLYFTKKAKSYNCFFDGLVYAVYLALGFALLDSLADFAPELIDCLESGLSLKDALQQSLTVALLRAGMDIVGHLTYAAVMGYYLSKGKVLEKAWILEYQLEERGLIKRPHGKSFFPHELSARKAVLIPALLHGAVCFVQQLSMSRFPALSQPYHQIWTIDLLGGYTLTVFDILLAVVMTVVYAFYFVMLRKAHKTDDYLLNLAMDKIRRKYPGFAKAQAESAER